MIDYVRERVGLKSPAKGCTMASYVATAEIEINASPAQVWVALTDPQLIKKYMFGSQVETAWQQGSSIVWKGEYEGKAYEDKGEIVGAAIWIRGAASP